jgi:CRP-like cAMP-binding protein
MCTLLAFTRSDILELRSLSVTGNICFMVFTLRQKMILWPNIFWSSLFASVNGYKIYEIFEERNASVSMTKEEEKIFVDFFMPHGVTPKQFERIEQSAEFFKLKKGDLLIKKGDKPTKVYLIVDGSTDALVLGRRLTAASTNHDTKGDQKEGGDSGAWAGEMAFLKQFWEKEQKSIIHHNDEDTVAIKDEEGDNNDKITTNIDSKVNMKSSPPTGLLASRFEIYLYSIIAAEDCTIMSWSHEEMEELMKSSTDLRSALTRAMSSALVGKVVNLTISRAHNTKVPWSVWLKDWNGSSVEVADTDDFANLRLAEDKD